MRFSGAAAVAAATSAAGAGTDSYFVWQPPHRSITVRIVPEVLAEIGRRTGSASPQLGGILLGRVHNAGTYIVAIESFEAVEGQFWKGFPQAHDDPVRLAFELALARRRPAGDRSLCAVGYYRAEETGALLGPSNSDLMLIARYFSAPHHVFLFVRPGSATHVAMGGFTCWEFGQIPETVDREFPLDAGLLSAAAMQLPALSESKPDPAPGNDGAAPWTSTDQANGLPRSRFRLLASAIVLLLLIAAAAGFFLMPRDAVPRSAPAEVRRLALTAERSGTDYRVTWDRNAPGVTSAFKGALSITDGEFRRVIELDPGQLKGGSLLYTPMTGDALIQLDVAGPGGLLTESVRVLSPSVPIAGSVQPPPLVVKPVPAQPPAQQVAAASAARPVTPSRSFTPPAARPSVAPVPAPPELTAAATTVQWNSPPVPTPTQTPPPEPARQRETPPPAPQTPARVSDYRPPRPIQQPRPVMTSFVRQALLGKGSQPIRVDVEITIDAAGKVSAVKPYVGGDATLRRLWSAAADAAKNWTFQAATLNGQPIESSMTLSFNFVGTGSR